MLEPQIANANLVKSRFIGVQPRFKKATFIVLMLVMAWGLANHLAFVGYAIRHSPVENEVLHVAKNATKHG